MRILQRVYRECTVYTGSASMSVANATPLSLSLSGPSNVKPLAECVWSVIAQGGATPYSYEWRVGAVPQSSTTDEPDL